IPLASVAPILIVTIPETVESWIGDKL
ncbi:hypothetical protein LCGC14_1390140, partial [marine sediment metagenome]